MDTAKNLRSLEVLMIKVKKVYVNDENDNAIVIDGSLSNVEREEVLDMCSRWKNMFLFGLPHHATKRKLSAKAGIIYKKWTESPKVCISYIPKQLKNGDLAIKLLFSSTSKKRAKAERLYFIQLFQQNIIEEIESLQPQTQ